MAVEHAPQHLPHLPTPGEMLEWIGHHKTRLTMAAIALGGAGYLMVAHDRGSQNPAVTVNNPISDTLKPADPGSDSEAVVPAVVPTETPIPPPTAKPTETATATPEPTKAPPKEKPTSLTAANFSEFVGTVSKDEFKKLAKSQPDAFAFPVKSLSGDLEMTYQDIPTSVANVKGNGKSISATGSNILLISSIDGNMTIRKDDHFNKDKITSIWIHRKLSENSFLTLYIYTGNSNDVSMIENVGPTERGQALAKVSGKVGISIYLQELLTEPVVINRPDGGKTEFNGYVTYLSPSIFENSGWVSKDGKAVTSQN